MMRAIDGYIKSYKRVHSSTMLAILRSYNEWERVKGKKKWKRGAEQFAETKAIESILTNRGIKFEKIVGKRKKWMT